MACFICLGVVNSCCGELRSRILVKLTVIIHDPSLVSCHLLRECALFRAKRGYDHVQLRFLGIHA